MLKINKKAIFHRDIIFDENKTIYESVKSGEYSVQDPGVEVAAVIIDGEKIEFNLSGAIIVEELNKNLSIEKIKTKLAEISIQASEEINKDVDTFVEALRELKVLV